MVHETRDPLIGQVLDGRYSITRLLGSGGMGAVYEAHQQRLNRKVAIKTIHAHLASKGIVVERFRREAMAAASAGSQHIVDVYDLGVMPNGAPYMVMELIEGTDLRSLVETQGRLASSRAAHIVRQACDALEAAHEMGIIHRDVKPENIMVTQRRNDPSFVKVVDFGISKLRDSSLTGSHELLGTPYAMAPEQLRGAGHVDSRCDVYGLGVCLYWALSAQVPYDADALPLLIAQISSGQGVALKTRVHDLPEAAYHLVATAMASDPDKRFRTMRAFSAALRTLENATPSAAHAPTAVAPTPKRPEPSPPPPEPAPASEPAREPPEPKPPGIAPTFDTEVHFDEGHGVISAPVHARDTTQRGRDSLPTTFGSKLFRLVVTLALLGGAGAAGFFGFEVWQRHRAVGGTEHDAGMASAQNVDGGVAQGIETSDTPEPTPRDDSPVPNTPTSSRRAATIVVAGLPGADVQAGDWSCVSPCTLTVPDGRVRIGYADHWLPLELEPGEERRLALGAARIDIEDDAPVTIDQQHVCRGGCVVPLAVGRHTAMGTWDSTSFDVHAGEVTAVNLRRSRPGQMSTMTSMTTMTTPTGQVNFMERQGSVRIRVAGRTCHTPCTLHLPAGEYRVSETRDGRTSRHALTVRAGRTINVGYNEPIQLMRPSAMTSMETMDFMALGDVLSMVFSPMSSSSAD